MNTLHFYRGTPCYVLFCDYTARWCIANANKADRLLCKAVNDGEAMFVFAPSYIVSGNHGMWHPVVEFYTKEAALAFIGAGPRSKHPRIHQPAI